MMKPTFVIWSRAFSTTRVSPRGPRATAIRPWRKSPSRRPNLVFLDIWLQGSKLDGLQLLEQIKRDHADLPVVMISGHGNIETAVAAIKRGRLRFHRETVQSRPADPGRDASAGDLAPEARGEGAQATGPRRERPDRPLGLHESVAPDHRQGRQGQQPHSDRGSLGLRQGIGGAHAALCVEPCRRTLRRHQRGGDHAGAHGNRTVRRRAIQRRASAQGRCAGGSPWRHPVYR